MLYRYFLSTLYLVILLTLFSCETGDKTIGSNFMDSHGVIIEVDTLTVNFSSYLLDSVKTSDSNVALVGSIEDNHFGGIMSQSFTVFGRTTEQLSEDAVFDSLVLGLNQSGYYYGDTLAKLEFSVHRITQKLEYPESGASMYNTTTFSYDDQSLGDFSIFPKPTNKVKISTHLNPALGEEFLSLFKKKSDALSTTEDFIDYFNGIVLVPTSAKAIVGFAVDDTSMFMKLYYHVPGVLENESQFVTLSPYMTDKQFNQIISKREGTLTENIDLIPVNTSSTGGYSYVQGGTGIVSRVDFPSLSDVLKTHKNVQIIRAELIVQPIYSYVDNLPSVLNLYYTNKHNDFLEKLTTTSGTELDGDLHIDYINGENTYYSWDVSKYVEEIMGENASRLNGLLIVPEDYASGFDRVVVADQFKSKYRTKLKLYTISYE